MDGITMDNGMNVDFVGDDQSTQGIPPVFVEILRRNSS